MTFMTESRVMVLRMELRKMITQTILLIIMISRSPMPRKLMEQKKMRRKMIRKMPRRMIRRMPRKEDLHQN
jgi:hypothetical protein